MMDSLSRRMGRARLPSLGAAADIYLLLTFSLIMIGVFGALNPAWLSLQTLLTAIEQNAPLAVVAMAMTFSIIAGIIDLSPGSLIALTGVIIGLTNQHAHNLFVAILAGLVVAVAISAFNGFLVVALRINAVIVTLAAYIWARGLATGLTGTSSIAIGGPFIDFMNSFSALGLSAPIYIVAFAYLGGWFLLTRTRFGLHTRATGGDARGARRAGINTHRQVIAIFCLMGAMVTVGAIISVSQMASAQPLTASGLELDAIIAVIIGGSRLTGGEGSVIKTLAGVIFIAVLNNGLSNVGISDAPFAVYKGCAILAALTLQTLARRRAERLRVQADLARGSEASLTMRAP
ncbi:MAG TPA: ABC transporter permease [Chloroflexota bacterium]|nr:ABC transporter permease [Chloroflexota bacterium]